MLRLAIPALSLGLYLSFAAFNSRHVTLGEIALWSIFALAVGIVALLISWKVAKPPTTQVLSGFVMLLGFYSYGYVFNASEPTTIMTVIYKIMYVSLIPLVIIVIRHKDLGKIWKPFLATIAIVSIVYPSAMIIIPPKVVAHNPTTETNQVVLDKSVYIILFDRYARADILEKYFGYDNSPFLDELKARGFEIAEKGRTNYNMTTTAFASLLNLEYLDTLLPNMPDTERSYIPIYDLMKGSRLELLAGGSWVKLGSWWKGTEDAQSLLGEYPSKMLLSTIIKPVIILWDGWQRERWTEANTKELSGGVMLYTKEWALHLLHHQFRQLHKLAKSPDNTLIVAHIISPHPPYAADASGNPPDETLPLEKLYVGQLQYTNKLILELLDDIPEDDIVILTADEGPKGLGYAQSDAQILGKFTKEEKLEMHQTILMAVKGFEIYPDITLVNAMRLLANNCMDTDFELLEDKVFDVPDWELPYKWIRTD